MAEKIIGRFISGTKGFNTFEKNVPAPYIRKIFSSDCPTVAKIKIAACGFYELFINGKNYTKGHMAPYISNTDDFIYYDEYTVPLKKGMNAVGIILGNGFQNNPGGYAWSFDKAPFRSAPMVALDITYTLQDGSEITVSSGKDFKVHPSPILSDDYRFGVHYDARCEIADWCTADFDDTSWDNALEVTPPKGKLRRCSASPIVSGEELTAKSITKTDEGYIFDFGQSNAGVCRLKIKGKSGQKITIRYADDLKDGRLDIAQIWFFSDNIITGVHNERDSRLVHCDTYILKGEGTEEYTPSFTYHGFRYALIIGADDTQISNETLTYVTLHSDLKTAGGFKCSDDMANLIQEATRRSDISNIHYFPTDCPQREKNGWTADAALSSEQMLLNFTPEKEYSEWLRNIVKAQRADGALPGIVPTTGWGFDWGNGPAWDCVLAYLPYYTYIYRGETEIIHIAADALIKYLKYLISRRDENGLIHIGLGDWCQVGRDPEDFTAPLELTDTIIAADIAEKTALMLNAVERFGDAEFAENTANDFRKAARDNLIDRTSMTAAGSCQTSQAMCIYYNIFDEADKPKAFERLLEMISIADGHMDVGVLGGRVIFHVLSEFGYDDLAYNMIVRPDFPSYGNIIKRGATTLWEAFYPDKALSENHHFWGDVSAWFIKRVAGICINPDGTSLRSADITPAFIEKLSFAEGWHSLGGENGEKIYVSWKRGESDKNKIALTVECPEGVNGRIILKNGWHFENGASVAVLKSGVYMPSR